MTMETTQKNPAETLAARLIELALEIHGIESELDTARADLEHCRAAFDIVAAQCAWDDHGKLRPEDILQKWPAKEDDAA